MDEYVDDIDDNVIQDNQLPLLEPEPSDSVQPKEKNQLCQLLKSQTFDYLIHVHYQIHSQLKQLRLKNRRKWLDLIKLI